jgi:hypothetical protein
MRALKCVTASFRRIASGSDIDPYIASLIPTQLLQHLHKRGNTVRWFCFDCLAHEHAVFVSARVIPITDVLSVGLATKPMARAMFAATYIRQQ